MYIAELDAVVKPIYGESSEWLRSRRRALFSGKPIYGEESLSAEGGQEHGQTPVFNAESGQSPVFNAESGQSPGLAGGNDCGNNGDDGDDGDAGEGSTGESGNRE